MMYTGACACCSLHCRYCYNNKLGIVIIQVIINAGKYLSSTVPGFHIDSGITSTDPVTSYSCCLELAIIFS